MYTKVNSDKMTWHRDLLLSTFQEKTGEELDKVS